MENISPGRHHMPQVVQTHRMSSVVKRSLAHVYSAAYSGPSNLHRAVDPAEVVYDAEEEKSNTSDNEEKEDGLGKRRKRRRRRRKRRTREHLGSTWNRGNNTSSPTVPDEELNCLLQRYLDENNQKSASMMSLPAEASPGGQSVDSGYDCPPSVGSMDLTHPPVAHAEMVYEKEHRSPSVVEFSRRYSPCEMVHPNAHSGCSNSNSPVELNCSSEHSSPRVNYSDRNISSQLNCSNQDFSNDINCSTMQSHHQPELASSSNGHLSSTIEDLKILDQMFSSICDEEEQVQGFCNAFHNSSEDFNDIDMQGNGQHETNQTLGENCSLERSHEIRTQQSRLNDNIVSHEAISRPLMGSYSNHNHWQPQHPLDPNCFPPPPQSWTDPTELSAGTNVLMRQVNPSRKSSNSRWSPTGGYQVSGPMRPAKTIGVVEPRVVAAPTPPQISNASINHIATKHQTPNFSGPNAMSLTDTNANGLPFETVQELPSHFRKALEGKLKRERQNKNKSCHYHHHSEKRLKKQRYEYQEDKLKASLSGSTVTSGSSSSESGEDEREKVVCLNKRCQVSAYLAQNKPQTRNEFCQRGDNCNHPNHFMDFPPCNSKMESSSTKLQVTTTSSAIMAEQSCVPDGATITSLPSPQSSQVSFRKHSKAACAPHAAADVVERKTATMKSRIKEDDNHQKKTHVTTESNHHAVDNNNYHQCGGNEKKMLTDDSGRRAVIEHDKSLEVEWFHCPIDWCPFYSNKKWRLDRHSLFHVSGQAKGYKCPDCPSKRFQSLAKQLKHDRECHTHVKDYECKVCLDEVTDLNSHMKTHEMKKEFTCNQCLAQFRHKNSLVRHMYQHTDDRPFQCQSCDKSFISQTRLRDHMRTCHSVGGPSATEQKLAEGIDKKSKKSKKQKQQQQQQPLQVEIIGPQTFSLPVLPAIPVMTMVAGTNGQVYLIPSTEVNGSTMLQLSQPLSFGTTLAPSPSSTSPLERPDLFDLATERLQPKSSKDIVASALVASKVL